MCRRFLSILLLGVFLVASAHAQTPTPEQLEAFRNLPPDQQKAVLDAVSSGQSSGGVNQSEPVLDDADKSKSIQPAVPAAKPDADKIKKPLPPRTTGGSTLLLTVKTPPADDPQVHEDQRTVLDDRRQRILAGNPFVLSEDGELALPFMPAIPVGGLTAPDVERRLNSDPRLKGLTFQVSILAVTPAGSGALKPFGYDLFEHEPGRGPNTSSSIPVPSEYVVGPGDTILLELFGKKSGRYSLVVDRDGRIKIPDLGPMQAAGSSFESLRSEIERRVGEQTIGVRASVTMGQLRSIRIFALGDVARPGSYVVSGLSTVTNALFMSGGVSPVGSLRRIEVKRHGRSVAKLDLYELLLRGDTSQDVPLESGDVIFVPPIGATAAVGGEVRRPAIYEMLEGATVADLLVTSGGVAPTGNSTIATLERVNEKKDRVVLDVDTTTSEGAGLKLRSGDVLTIPRVLDEYAGGVSVEGAVLRPGRRAWREGVHLTDVLGNMSALREDADERYVLIRRETMPDRRIQIVSADATKAFKTPHSADDPVLAPRDRIMIFSLQRDRGYELEAVLKDLRQQARDSDAPPIVSVGGRVKAPGEYPLESAMRVSALVRAGGGLDEGAFNVQAELTRYVVGADGARQSQILNLDLAAILRGDPAADVPLQAFDVLLVKETPDWNQQGYVWVQGEVRFPGRYPVRKGEKLGSVIQRAGGLTEYAFPDGSVFTREEIKEQERKQLDTLASRMQTDLAVLSLQNAQSQEGKADAGQTLSIGQSLLADLKSTKPVGRLVINLNDSLGKSAGSEADIEVSPGDTLTIPRTRRYVTLLGEVQNATAHVWRQGLDRDQYISLSGGLTQRADAKRIYVVRADGSVVAREGGKWFHRGGDVDMKPGDTVVAPLNTERVRPLTLWTSVTQIIYNLAIAAAAVNSF